MDIAGEEIDYTRSIDSLFSAAAAGQINYRLETVSTRLSGREKHYTDLNRVLKKRRRESCDSTVYSSVSWDDVSEVYEKMLVGYTQPVEDIPEHDMEEIMDLVRKRVQRIGRPSATKSERVNSTFIESIILHICDLFPKEDNIRYDMEVPLACPEMNYNGFADFFISRGDRKIIIVEAKKDDIGRGLAQSLLMMDAAAAAINQSNGESAQTIYGIVSDFRSWNFVKCSDGLIQMDEDVVSLQHRLGEDISRVAGKLYHILRHG